jgi:hypothetical protein
MESGRGREDEDADANSDVSSLDARTVSSKRCRTDELSGYRERGGAEKEASDDGAVAIARGVPLAIETEASTAEGEAAILTEGAELKRFLLTQSAEIKLGSSSYLFKFTPAHRSCAYGGVPQLCICCPSAPFHYHPVGMEPAPRALLCVHMLNLWL